MEENKENEISLIKSVKKRIEEINRLTEELKEIGKGMPVIEKNARCILSFTHALKFGISDIVEVMDNKGE